MDKETQLEKSSMMFGQIQEREKDLLDSRGIVLLLNAYYEVLHRDLNSEHHSDHLLCVEEMFTTGDGGHDSYVETGVVLAERFIELAEDETVK